MADQKAPKGLVATFSDETGRVIASVSDFNTDKPGDIHELHIHTAKAVITALLGRNA